MFQFLKNWIVNTATVIEEKELEATQKRIQLEEDEKAKRKARVEKRRDFVSKLRDKLGEHFLAHAAKLEATINDLHIKVGDRVVVNKFELAPVDSRNGWDTGASALCRHYYAWNKDIYGPIYAKILKIRVSESYFWESVDKFLDDEGHSWLGYGEGEMSDRYLDNVVTKYLHWWGKRKKMTIIDEFGFYLDAAFELENIDFKPQWGLNVYSFLQVDSEEGKKTIEAWEYEEQIHDLQVEYSEKKKNLEHLHSMIMQ